MKTIRHFLLSFLFLSVISCGETSIDTPDNKDKEPETEQDYPDSVIARIGITSSDIVSISISNPNGGTIVADSGCLVDSTSFDLLESSKGNAVEMLPKTDSFLPGTYQLKMLTAGFSSPLRFTFLKSSDDAVAVREIDAKALKVVDGAIDFGNVDSDLSWTPATRITLEFINSSLFNNPFASPADYSKTYKSPTVASELVTPDNLVFNCKVSLGFVKHDTYGFRVCVKDSDSIILPRINGMQLAAFRTTTVKGSDEYMFSPACAGIEGLYCAVPDEEGKRYGWHFIASSGNEPAIEFRNPTTQEYLEFRSAKWELFYTGTAAPTVTGVATALASDVQAASAVLNGSFRTYRNEAASLFTCGFEYREEDGEWKNIDCTTADFQFSTQLSGMEQGKKYIVRAWAADSGKKIYGDEITVSPAATDPDSTIKVLGIGNSWTRDSYRYISGIVKSAGVKAVIAHAYLGGSGLEDQFYGIDDLSYSYSHSSKQQIVHSTYQYWLYDGTDDPKKTPLDDDYGNGLKGVGVTLESILKDRDWDVITFQPSSSVAMKMDRYLGKESADPTKFSMERFVEKVKGLLPSDVAAKVKIGLLVPWSYPIGCTSHPSSIYTWTGDGAPADQNGWDRQFEKLYVGIQDGMKTLSSGMGPCHYYVNVGKAIYFGRQNETLLSSGFKLQREADDTHLSEGVAKYLASLMFAYEIFSLKPEQISYSPTTYDFSKSKIEAAKEVAWAAWKGDSPVEVTSVKTSVPEKISETGVLLKGSFLGQYPNSAKDFTCGFEYKEGDGEWQVITMNEPFYEFTYKLTGLNSDKSYTVRAWAACASGKKYGSEQSVNFGDSVSLVLAPTLSDFKSQGIPASTAYPVTGTDPGQDAFANKEFVYTHPSTGDKYSFYFYGKGPQYYSSSKYFLYYAYSGSDFLFGKAGSYVKLPAVPGMRLESVTLTCSDSGKSWGIAATLDQISDRSGIPGGEKHQFNSDSYTFKLSDTATNTSYYIFSASGTAKVKFTSIVYSN